MARLAGKIWQKTLKYAIIETWKISKRQENRGDGKRSLPKGLAKRITNRSSIPSTAQWQLYKDLAKLITYISDYLLTNQKKLRKEVKKTMGGEILELPSERLIKKAKREGRQEGELKGTIKTLVSLVKKGTISIKQAAEQLGESEEKFNARLAKAK